jgi:ABC-2 type transport system ATP-binding protein
MSEVDAIVVNGIAKTYRDFFRRPVAEALRGVSFRVPRGAVYGLIGPNGSGKSTTVKLLLGLLRPDRGEIAVFGFPPAARAARKRLGYLPELSRLHDAVTPAESLAFFAALHGLPRAVARERTAQLLEMTGLSREKDRPLSTFSKGMARRVALAQALVHDPDLLVLDEPTSGLDPQGMRQTKDLILALARRGKTVLVTSHLLSDVEELCDRVAILHAGRVLAEGTIPGLLTKREKTCLSFETPAESAALDRLVAELEARVAGPVEVSHPRERLEEYFLSAVASAAAGGEKTAGADTEARPLAPFLRD